MSKKKFVSDINIRVELDENRVPDKILWNAKDGGVEAARSKAMLLSIWDHKVQETLRIDLWTKDMPVDEMKKFFHQTFVAMADTFERATEDKKMADTMRDFCEYFAEKMDLVDKEK
ncbi:gliding motility protein GldC [Myroides injenensis]|uniref:gliding motility protein GldC n=1 Tax=Myroides injenensis TaxID=1183151 RepID=UPI00226E52C9|nr:gliding motility protein GldC [Myroides injenensis]